MNTKTNTIRKFVSSGDKLSRLSPIGEFGKVKVFVIGKGFFADLWVRLCVVGMQIASTLTATLACVVVSVENCFNPRFLNEAMNDAAQAGHTSAPVVMAYPTEINHGAWIAAACRLLITRCSAKFHTAINAVFIISDKFCGDSKPVSHVLNALFGLAKFLRKISVRNFSVKRFEDVLFAFLPNIKCHIAPNENRVNCWKPLLGVTIRAVDAESIDNSLYYSEASNGKRESSKNNEIGWAISSQATLKKAEGSTSRSWSLNFFGSMAVKAHECANRCMGAASRCALSSMETC